MRILLPSTSPATARSSRTSPRTPASPSPPAPRPRRAAPRRGDGVYAAGDSVTVSALPNAGFAFANWTVGGAVVSTRCGLHLHRGGRIARWSRNFAPGHHHHRHRIAGSGRHDPGRGRLRQRRERHARSGRQPGFHLHETGPRAASTVSTSPSLHIQRHRRRARSWRTSRRPTPSPPRRGRWAAAPCSARAASRPAAASRSWPRRRRATRL